MSNQSAADKVHVIGRPPNFWLFSESNGYDLTHPTSPDSPSVSPRIKIQATNSPVTIAPHKSAIVVIDMMNFFLSPAIGRPEDSAGLKAEQALLKHTIPAARKAGIQVIWVNWGFTEAELETLSPTVWRGFGYRADTGNEPSSTSDSKFYNRERKLDQAVGEPLGTVKLKDGSTIEAGRLHMRDQWNTALHESLAKAYEVGSQAKVPDVLFHKTRLSALWESSSDLLRFLEERELKTLFITGVNTDQCVLSTLQDANHKGYDTILLSDSVGTSSPDFARQTVEFNCQKNWGFLTTGRALYEAVESS
ncbi:MAG: hypothetical protein MMC23_007979 [Stictis urceolatum]|nr:hypothetical protein [Stictis urceolata]